MPFSAARISPASVVASSPRHGSVTFSAPGFSSIVKSAPWVDLVTLSTYIPPAEGADVICFATEFTASANKTLFLGPGGASLTRTEVERKTVAGSVAKLVASAESAPGSGQTFTYTLQKNGSDTGLTLTLSGGSQADGVATGTVTYADLDSWSVKLVTSSGAQAVRHAVILKFTPS